VPKSEFFSELNKACTCPAIFLSASTRCLTLGWLQKLNLHDSGYKNDRLEQFYNTDIETLPVQQPSNLKTKRSSYLSQNNIRFFFFFFERTGRARSPYWEYIKNSETYGSFWLHHNEYKFKEKSHRLLELLRNKNKELDCLFDSEDAPGQQASLSAISISH
jgi:hypothetical protein